jgi:hypothetical protein
MSEQDLLAELHRVADACESLDQEVTRAAQWQRFCRAIEGHLMRVRGQLRPLKQDE